MKITRTDRFIRHADYVDRRLEIICAAGSVNTRDNIGSLVELVYGDTPLPPAEKSETADAIAELHDIFSRWNIISDGDLGGYILQTLDSRIEKKSRGQFFTPPDIVRQMLGSIPFPEKKPEDIKIFDPACGTGQFLLQAYEILLDLYLSAGVEKEQASASIVLNNLYGNDIDPVSAQIARLNLSILSGVDISRVHVSNHDYLFRDDLGTGQGLSASENFDIIIGNPPWGSSLSASEKSYVRGSYLSALSGINAFTLFIERSLDFLPEGGHLSFLIPEAYLNIRAHMKSRQLILDSCRIRSIRRWGEQFRGVFAPSISIHMQKDSSEPDRTRNIIEIVNPEKNQGEMSTLIPQDCYNRNVENIFNTRYNRRASDILSIISAGDNAYLENRSTFFLGVVTGDNKGRVLPFPAEGHPDPIIVGKDIQPYRINFSNHYFRLESDKLQQVAPHHLYRTKDKLLYRFIGRRLTFALDRQGYCMLNNVNGIIPRIDDLSAESLLSLLNSRVMQYYYEMTFFTVKVLRGNLERLPLRRLSVDSQKKIAKIICLLAERENTLNCMERENIEDILFHEYGLSDAQAYLISDFCEGKGCAGESENTAYISMTSSLPSSNSARPLS